MRLNRLTPTRHSSATSSHTAPYRPDKAPPIFYPVPGRRAGLFDAGGQSQLGPHSILLQDQQGVNGQPLTPYTTGWANHLGT